MLRLLGFPVGRTFRPGWVERQPNRFRAQMYTQSANCKNFLVLFTKKNDYSQKNYKNIVFVVR